MKKVLVIDDLRTFIDYDGDVTYARTDNEGATALINGEVYGGWDEVFLDHDLGDGSKRGGGHKNPNLWGDIRPLVRHIVWCAEEGMPYTVKQFYVCTDNPPGRDWVIGMLEPYYPVRFYQPPYRVDWEKHRI